MGLGYAFLQPPVDIELWPIIAVGLYRLRRLDSEIRQTQLELVACLMRNFRINIYRKSAKKIITVRLIKICLSDKI